MLWVKVLHLLFVISWFAGLFYLPRIFVNLAQARDPIAHKVLLGMARRLYNFMTPLGVLAIAFGLWLWLAYGIGRGEGWLHAKLLLVLALVAQHLFCRHYLLAFTAGNNTRSQHFFRIFNEIPVLLLVAILILVVLKPF